MAFYYVLILHGRSYFHTKVRKEGEGSLLRKDESTIKKLKMCTCGEIGGQGENGNDGREDLGGRAIRQRQEKTLSQGDRTVGKKKLTRRADYGSGGSLDGQPERELSGEEGERYENRNTHHMEDGRSINLEVKAGHLVGNRRKGRRTEPTKTTDPITPTCHSSSSWKRGAARANWEKKKGMQSPVISQGGNSSCASPIKLV